MLEGKKSCSHVYYLVYIVIYIYTVQLREFTKEFKCSACSSIHMMIGFPLQHSLPREKEKKVKSFFKFCIDTLSGDRFS